MSLSVLCRPSVLALTRPLRSNATKFAGMKLLSNDTQLIRSILT